MGVTLLESALYTENQLKAGVAKTIYENSPILDRIKFTEVEGNAYQYNLEQALPSIAFRGVNQTWTQSTGVINPYIEPLVIMGGEVFVDNFQIKTQSNKIDLKAKQYDFKSRAASLQFNKSFFLGDSNVDPNSFDGLKKRLTGNQVIAASGGTTDTTLTLAMLDQLLDTVPFDNKMVFCNRFLRRKITSLIRSSTGSYFIEEAQDEYGKQNIKYAGVPIYIMENMFDGTSILDFSEDPGDGVADTASIYCVAFGDDELVHGIMNGNWDVNDFGEIPAAPGHLGRIELYLGLAIEHPRAAARLYQLLQS